MFFHESIWASTSLDKVTGLRQISGDEDMIRFAWDDNNYYDNICSGYSFEYSTDKIHWYDRTNEEWPATESRLSYLSSGTSYYVRIRKYRNTRLSPYKKHYFYVIANKKVNGKTVVSDIYEYIY